MIVNPRMWEVVEALRALGGVGTGKQIARIAGRNRGVVHAVIAGNQHKRLIERVGKIPGSIETVWRLVKARRAARTVLALDVCGGRDEMNTS